MTNLPNGDAGRLAIKAHEVGGHALRHAVRRKGPQRRCSGTFVCFEHAAGQDRRRAAQRIARRAPRKSCGCWPPTRRQRQTTASGSRRPRRRDGTTDPSSRIGRDRETSSSPKTVPKLHSATRPSCSTRSRPDVAAVICTRPAQRRHHMMAGSVQCPRKPQPGKGARAGQQNPHRQPRNRAASGPAGS